MNIKYTFAIILSAGLFLTGCQTIKKAPELTHTPENQTKQQFKITGKIGVRTPQQNGSAFYGWTQVDHYFAIDLTGALGIGQTSIKGEPGDVTLTSSKTGALQAATPEELLYKATGWEAPITNLISWINARPVHATAKIIKDQNSRIQNIQEDGWTATLSYNASENLPNRLVLVDDAQQNRVTLTIQTRE